MVRALVLVLLAVLLVGCRKTERAGEVSTTASVSASSAPVLAYVDPPLGDVQRGKALVAKFECNRCHALADVEVPALDKDCVRCHQQIHAGTYSASKSTLAKWQKTIVHFRDTPSLVNVGGRLRRGFIEQFLLEPRDLRPHMDTSMPRLEISPEEARDIATYLTNGSVPAKPFSLDGANAQKGASLFEDKGCRQCHEYTGAPKGVTSAGIPAVEGTGERRGHSLAPDLRYVRERMNAGEIARWLEDPQAINPETAMPKTPLTPEEIRDLVAFLTQQALAEKVNKPVPTRLPVLTRKVTYDEVSQRVFRNTCWHCHAEPDYAIGDGGPGNTGGYGFKPRGLNLAEYEGIQAGYVDDKGERRSIFSPMPDGTPRLVYALLARHKEESGQRDPVVRGMPMGLPSVTPEDIQLVETWIAQGRPQ
ncbi:MAG TPA: c-type cytochrome [Polyangium sp.]|nr:c-type cytochrome [Polyangium sp.]